MLPRAVGLYPPNVAHTFILVTKAIYILFISKYVCGSCLLPDLTGHLTAQADVGHATPLSVSGKTFRLTFILLSVLVRFTVYNLIEPHASPVVVSPRQFL